MTSQGETTGRRERLKHGASLPGEALRVALRDPEHVPERLLLRVTDRLAGSCAKWADRVKAGPAEVADVAAKEYWRTVYVARFNGAIAGTPFFIALVPAYLVFLEQEYRFFMKMAALAGRNPADLSVAADFLVLRGVHGTSAEALAALELVKDTPPPPPTDRRPLKYWYQSVMTILVYAGFLAPPDPEAEKKNDFAAKLRMVGGVAVAGAIWVFTSIFPLSFMVLMSWTCERDARKLGQSSLEHWELEATGKLTRAERREKRSEMTWRMRIFTLIRGLILLATLAVPLFLVGGSIVNSRWKFGWDIPQAAASLAGLALVIGVAVAATWDRGRGVEVDAD